jgi:hypothetical protein
MKLFELVIDDTMDEIFALSFVSDPAIEVHGTYFHKDKVQFREIKEEGLFVAPILVPNKRIFRMDGEGKPYEVFFSPETIKKLSQMYLKRKYQDSITIEHEDKVKDVTLVESWIKESKLQDKSKLYGIDVPVGSWLGTFKIDNEEIKDKFRKGEISAVSIEGLFTHDLVKASRIDINHIEEQEAEYLLSQMRALIKKDMRYNSKKRIEMESYSDYGQGIRNNAKRGIELNEKNGNKCATPVGKVRAQQLAQGKPISVETIKRMYSYLSRAETYYDESDTQACGTISFLLWGGKSALSWSRNKLRELGLLQENEAQPSIPSSTYPGEAGTMVTGSLRRENIYMEDGELNVFGYDTSHFYICPGAIGTFNHLVNEMDIQDDDLQDMIRAGAVIADSVFMIEKKVLDNKMATPMDLRRAETLVEMFKDVFETVDERTGMKHDISYMDGHIEVIKSYLK